MKPRNFAALFLIAAYIAIGFLFVGCASARRQEKPAPAAAYVATESARLHVAKARVAVERVKAPVDSLAAQEVKAALDQADAVLDDAGSKIETMQHQMGEIAKAKADADERERKADDSRLFWRAWTMRLAGICLAFGLWTFRKPLLLIAGL